MTGFLHTALIHIMYQSDTLSSIKLRLLIIVVAIDCLLFAIITLGNCRRNETISAASYALEQQGKWQGKLFRPLIDKILSPLEKDHCRMSWLLEKDTYLY